MKSKHLMPLMLGGLVWFSSCDSETASPQAQMGLEFTTVKSESLLTGRLSAANSLAFTSGTITLKEAKFEGKSDVDSLEVEFELEQNVTIDFATGATSPDINAVFLKPGIYEKVEVELELQDEGTVPAIVLNGTFTDAQGQAHPVRFEFNSDEEFEVKREGAITFTEGQSLIAEVIFDPVKWFAGVSPEQLSAASKNAEGVIVISESHNTGIFETVAEGLELASEVKIKE